MDPAVLQAARRVMDWRLSHTLLRRPTGPDSDSDSEGVLGADSLPPDAALMAENGEVEDAPGA